MAQVKPEPQPDPRMQPETYPQVVQPMQPVAMGSSSQQTTTVVLGTVAAVQRPLKRDWSSGICGCFEDISSCEWSSNLSDFRFELIFFYGNVPACSSHASQFSNRSAYGCSRSSVLFSTSSSISSSLTYLSSSSHWSALYDQWEWYIQNNGHLDLFHRLPWLFLSLDFGSVRG